MNGNLPFVSQRLRNLGPGSSQFHFTSRELSSFLLELSSHTVSQSRKSGLGHVLWCECSTVQLLNFTTEGWVVLLPDG